VSSFCEQKEAKKTSFGASRTGGASGDSALTTRGEAPNESFCALFSKSATSFT
jgi:hypothetical protein